MNGGTQGLRVRRRGGRLTVTFRSAVLDPAAPACPLRIHTADGRLVVRGRLSSGSTGWVLSGRASCHRRTIRLEVGATRGPGQARASVEDHEYEAVIEGMGTGRYLLRVAHVWLLSHDLEEVLVMPAFEGPIVVRSGEPPGG